MVAPEWFYLSSLKWDRLIPEDSLVTSKLKRDPDEMLRDLFRQRGVYLFKRYLMTNHVHSNLRVPSKHSIAFVIGFLKGKSAVCIHWKTWNKRVIRLHFSIIGYCVSTVGCDEETVRKYVRGQEKVDKQQLNLFE